MKRNSLCSELQKRLKRLPEPYGNHYGVVPYPPLENPPDIRNIMSQHERALFELGRLQNKVSEQKTSSWLTGRILSRKEAISSSAMEGTFSTLDELLMEEETQSSDQSETKMVKEYAQCLDGLIPKSQQDKKDIFTKELICELHRRIMKDDPHYQDVPGEIRKRVVWIGGGRHIADSTYNPPPPDDVKTCLHDTINYLSKNPPYEMDYSSVIVRMAIAHGHFEAVHPFRDGNGRVGRLLLPLIMASEGYSPLFLSPYIEKNKQEYYDSLKASQQRHQWDVMVGFFSDAVVETIHEIFLTQKYLDDLKMSWIQKRKFRAGSAPLLALDILMNYPIMTVQRLSCELKVSFKQASQAMIVLEEAGILKERTGGRRNRVFACDEVMKIINRPFGETIDDIRNDVDNLIKL